VTWENLKVLSNGDYQIKTYKMYIHTPVFTDNLSLVRITAQKSKTTLKSLKIIMQTNYERI